MNTVRSIFKVGSGPSSSHTIAPGKAAQLFISALDDSVVEIAVDLYGSLAATGEGHYTEAAIRQHLLPYNCHVVFKPEIFLYFHPNAMLFNAKDRNGKIVNQQYYYSIGGGELADSNGDVIGPTYEYPFYCISEIIQWCKERDRSYFDYVAENESGDIFEFLSGIWDAMKRCLEAGLASKEDCLPGKLKLARRARKMQELANEKVDIFRSLNLVSAYALASSEQNAAAQEVVTAPTCGSCGVVPSVLYYFYRHQNLNETEILNALATAGLFGVSVAKRASVSGAQVGCQGEIGTACTMAAAAITQIQGGTLEQIEYAAEMAMEHFLGLTCDPVDGLVQVPCIERNAFAAMRAFECATYSLSTNGAHFVSFDDVVDVMNATGLDLQAKYKETALGGLAKILRRRP